MEEQKYEITFDNYERKNFMYSSFPGNKSVNPKHWDSKIDFWTKEIIKCCRFHNDVGITSEKLSERFSQNDVGKPKGLLVVLSSMYTCGQVILKSNVSDLSPCETWSQWSYKVAGNTSSWLWRRFVTGINEQSELVLKELLEENCLALLDFHYKRVKYEKTDNVVPWNVLQNVYTIGNRKPDKDNLTCIIGHLRNSGKCLIGLSENNEKIVKFRAKGQIKVESISKMDWDVVNLKKSIAKLTLECKRLEGECEQFKINAQMLAKKNEKVKAKKELAHRQKLQKKLNMKHDALFSMKENLRTVQEAETTKLITDAFNSSATLLNRTYKGEGLTVDNIEEVMDKATEAKDMVNDVNEALSTGLQQLEGDDFDMDELEKELQELDTNNDVASADIDALLPNVPSKSHAKSSTREVNDVKIKSSSKPAAVAKKQLQYAM